MKFRSKGIFKKLATCLLLLAGILLLHSCSGEKEVKIWMIGDSTMAVKKPEAYPETGWGMGLEEFVKGNASIHNHARNGRSSKSFIDEGRWQAVYDSIQPGDYVIIQFGHNDEKPKPDRHTDPFTSFKENLKKFIDETRSQGGHPIICSSIVRRHFDEEGNLKDTHGDYIVAAREIAKETNTPYVDMEALSRNLVTMLGPEKSKSLYLFCEPGEYPNRPNGVEDNTHPCKDGAREFAALFVMNVNEQDLPIKEYFQFKD